MVQGSEDEGEGREARVRTAEAKVRLALDSQHVGLERSLTSKVQHGLGEAFGQKGDLLTCWLLDLDILDTLGGFLADVSTW